MDRKQALELATFRLFAEAAPIDIDASSVRQPGPPFPDILCRVSSGEWVAFELVELADRSIKHGLAIARDEMPAFLETAVDELDRQRREAFRMKGRQRNVGVKVDASVSVQRRRALATLVVDILLDDRYQPDRDGALHRGAHPQFPADLQYIYLTPTHRDPGPTFDQVASGSYADEAGTLLTRKLATSSKYDSGGHRMELLAYYEDDFTPRGGRVRELEELAVELLPASDFDRVWLFSRPLRTVLAVWPG